MTLVGNNFCAESDATVRVTSRLGVCTALVYGLCERNELRSLRIGGALRFHESAVESFLARVEALMHT
jgi:excisionase family DNA binding protein